MCWFPPSHHLQVDRAIQYQAEGQDSLRWAFMCDYNKSNRKQVKETGLTRNQNWLLSATLAVVKLPGPCRMILLKEKVINYASHGSACLCQWSYRHQFYDFFLTVSRIYFWEYKYVFLSGEKCIYCRVFVTFKGKWYLYIQSNQNINKIYIKY